ncbi:tripartite motif-containing protein 2-like [Lytechinus variegatus]|uniref:tripartite motif-containing protein 2-like n=1 Tax=Lytechinus variegatus TaxID=7654 RepID=UPI001BB29976|nr:tripartite motif-containing protein 2-like [Lytechinus variegatus]
MADPLKNVISQSTECPVCLSTFTDPKILSCSHTFCKTCLDNLLECHGNYQIRCPVCRAVTQVPNQDVSKLQVNLALKNLIEDMKCHPQICMSCKSDEKSSAAVYCQDCGKYLCTTCLNAHSQWGDFIDHEVIAMSEILSGKVTIRRYRKCRKHPKEDEECFCSNCRRFTCFKCVVMEHKDEARHQVIEAAAYENRHRERIKDIKSKVDVKQACFQKYLDFIDDQTKLVGSAKKECIYDVNKAYNDTVRQLTERRDILLGEVKEKTEGIEKELEGMKTSAQKYITQLTTIADMVINRTKIPFDMDTLAAHDTLCEEIREAFDQEDPDYEKPRKSSKKGKSVGFERHVRNDELDLGKIVNVVAKDVELPTNDSMNVMVNTPDGRMAVGCKAGGINIFSSDGEFQQTVLNDVCIRGVAFLSDGRCIVIDYENDITLYTPEYVKLNVMFESLGVDEGGFSKLTVDDADLIYVSYRKAQKILVFSAAGGQAVREIPCNGYEPRQITSYDDSLLIGTGNTLRLMDNEGVVQHTLTKPGSSVHAAVSQGNLILLATMKHEEGLVSIDEYTNELTPIRNLVNDYKIAKPCRNWYYLQQYRSGEIAFCTPDRLYIFY